ncbi:MAG: D-alanyl-D-alanine carboxypeptidase [Homoserinimonas sp.]|jgi:D-alanyl-D-alanine carboxypeptidase (penicillin-binding protein 5/6)|nr:D-alanyl-D-alanine carboxypeptidase [Homoserinimonas sp.]
MPLTVAPKFLRRRVAVLGTAAIVLSGLAYLPIALLAPLAPTAAAAIPYELPVQELPDLAWPESAVTAVGAVGFPGILASGGSGDTTSQKSIASLSKIITSLVVLDKHPLTKGEPGPAITFTSADERLYDEYLAMGGLVKSVKAGLQLTQRDVMQVVLISSANNYAMSLAVWAFGSEAAFLDATKVWLAKNKLTSTQLYEPTGMEPDNVSTASDLLTLAKLAIADPVVSSIVAMPSAVVPHIGEIRNSNRLLGDIGIDGIKTGTLDRAGACLLFSADFTVGSHTVTVVGVALGGVSHNVQFPQVHRLLKSVADNFTEVVLAEQGDVFATYTTPWNDSATAVASEDATELVWGSPPVDGQVNAAALQLGRDGTSVGNVRFLVGDSRITVPLELEGDLEDPGIFWRLGNPFRL